MMLKDYLEKNGLTPLDFANLMKVSDKIVYKWLSGERVPKDSNKKKISQLTNGEIDANDWCGIK